eukprot:4830430-Pleurochrysis_carterae.AAC.2
MNGKQKDTLLLALDRLLERVEPNLERGALLHLPSQRVAPHPGKSMQTAFIVYRPELWPSAHLYVAAQRCQWQRRQRLRSRRTNAETRRAVACLHRGFALLF